jgi:hypothetical protein
MEEYFWMEPNSSQGNFQTWYSIINIIEIYNQDKFLNLKKIAMVTAEEVQKDEKIVFKPYIWN